jgi:CRP-like cAMP-binding protein
MGSMNEKERLLSRVDLLESLSAKEVIWLAFITPDVHFERHQMLYTPNHDSRLIFLLLEGRVHLYRMGPAQEHTMGIIYAGMMFGEAALSGRTQGEYAQALERSWVALLSLEILGELLRRNPGMGLRMASLLSERLQLYKSQLVDISLKEIPARLANLLLRLFESEGVVTPEGYYRITTSYTHEQLGNMIGATRVSVTRAFSRLRKTGAIDVRQHAIYATDLKALKRASE